MLRHVKLTIGLKLNPTSEQAKTLRETLELASEAANEISRIAWEAQVFNQFQIHKLAYKTIREKYNLSAQVDEQRKLLESRQGESDLVLRKGKWFLFATVNAIEPSVNEPNGFLGVDFGIARVASDSDGQSFTGAHIRNLRKRHGKLRARLQSKGTRSAKRLLKKRNRKEARFARNLNHTISKQIVDKAQRTNRGITIEDLKGIRARVRAGRKQRRERSSLHVALRRLERMKCAARG